MAETWTSVDGTVYRNEELSRTARMSPHYMTVLKDVVEPATEFAIGKRSGDKVGFRLYGRVALGTAYSALGETEKVPFGTLPMYHGTGTIYRRAFAIPWTGSREDLDRLDIESAVIKALRDHVARVENKVIYDALVAGASFTYAATGDGTPNEYQTETDGVCDDVSTRDYTLWDARKLKYLATKWNIPTFDGSNYVFAISPTVEDGLNGDVDSQGWVDIVKYAPGGAEGALRGELGKVQRARYVVDNDIIDDTVGTATAFGSGFYCGEDAIKEMMVYPMHFRVNMNLGGDFGNQKGIAWQSMVDYVVPWNHTTHGDARYIWYTSDLTP